jgi:hypothetical protein
MGREERSRRWYERSRRKEREEGSRRYGERRGVGDGERAEKQERGERGEQRSRR